MIFRGNAAGKALWWVLLTCWIVRLAGMISTTTAFWGVDSAAYLPAWFAWITWAIVGAALFRPIGTALTRGLERVGRQYETPSKAALLALFAAVALGVLSLPDRVGFTGDFLLRISSAKASGSPATIFPQAMPLDLWLHYTFPHEIARLRIAPVELTSRVVGAIEAAFLALLVVAVARRWGLRGAALASAGLVMLVGTPLTIFTGLNKAFTELALLAAALAAITWPGIPSFGRAVTTLVIFAVALALHRAALVLTSVVVLELTGWLRASALREHYAEQVAVLMMVLVAVAFASRALIPVAQMDLPSKLVWPLRDDSVDSLGMRVLDLANLVVFLAPSLVLLPAALLDSRVREDLKGQNGLWCACLAVPSALLIALVDTPQGYFRDWDMFAISGLLLSLVSALAIGRFLTRRRESAWLGAAIVLSTMVPCVQLLVLQTNTDAGLRRVASFVEAQPRRSEHLRASVLAFLGKRAWDSGDMALAAVYGRRAAELVPIPSMLTLWGEAEELQGNYAAAESAYARLVTTWPGRGRAWLGLARTRIKSGRALEAIVAAESALAIEPGSERAAELLREARDSYPR